jgi:outer membrane protein TolC
MRRAIYCGLVWFSLAFVNLNFPPQTAHGSESESEPQALKDPVISQLENITVLDLETAQRLGLRGKPSLAAAEERITQARELVSQAVAKYLPVLDTAVSASRIWLSDTLLTFNRSVLDFARRIDPEFRSVVLDVDDPEDYYRVRLRAIWTIFNGFARHFSLEAARLAETESQEALADARRLILASIARAYHKAQLARENVAIAEADADFNLRQMEDAQAAHRAGTTSMSDVLNFEVQVNSARSKLLQANREYEVAMIGLAALMGVPDGAFPPGMALAPLQPELPKELVLPEPRPLIDYAKENRPDVRRLNYLLERSRALVKVAKADFYPTLELFGTADGERTNDPSFDEADFTYEVGVLLTYRFFEGGGRLARVREASARASEAMKTLRDLLITVPAEVREAASDLQLAQRELSLQRSNVLIAQRNRDMVEKEYRAGQTSLVRLNEAQRDLTASQSRLALALAGLRQAWQNLYYTTGQILEPFGTPPSTS